ncbi:alpha-ribazole phosphatase CobZ [Methanotorris igneus]|uniref:Alpha-ribazole phosphatase CobZ n=1 Tax=Methanotorris igneus (strain DSM 5666 / JCM 11834 / Kol 5) TaxID=880724 RepID=F6BAL8_METIK|nr:alpha-ribazole phosphatase CobZ [Methanotorris igneus]AEF97031.1 alpha-ribazole phosphatase CobZ [Methanotorris igneus Kol 5]
MNILKILENFGITLEDLVDSGMELCICEEEEKEKIRKKLKETIIKELNNPNVSTLLIAAVKLEEEGKKGNLPFNYDEDPNYIYVDEVIGMAIANEIAGTRAIFNFRWYDAKKPGIIKELGLFLDDAIAGLIAGCMSKVFSE